MDTDSPLSPIPQSPTSPKFGLPAASSGDSNLSGSNVKRANCYPCYKKKRSCDHFRPTCTRCKRVSRERTYPADKVVCCYACRHKQRPCDKAQPTCGECPAHSLNCVYPIYTYEKEPFLDPETKEDGRQGMLQGSRRGGGLIKAIAAESCQGKRGGMAEGHQKRQGESQAKPQELEWRLLWVEWMLP